MSTSTMPTTQSSALLPLNSRRRTIYVLLSVILFFVTLWCYWLPFDPTDRVPAGPETYLLSHNIYAVGTFANPFYLLNTGPTAHLAPVVPAWHALLMKIFGDETAGAYAIKMSTRVALALTIALFPWFSRVLGMGEVNGFIAAGAWLLGKLREVESWEAQYVALLVALACVCYRRYLDRDRPDHRRWAWLLGFLMGFTILASPTVAPVFAAWMLYEIWRQRAAFRRYLMPFVVLPLFIPMPWIIRNAVVLHTFPVLRDNFGLELSVSNDDCAEYGIKANQINGCSAKVHPGGNLGEVRKVRAMGEIQYNRARLHEGIAWITANPMRFGHLTKKRFIAFWFPTETFTIPHYTSNRKVERIVIYVITLLSIPGLFALYRRDRKSFWVLFSCLALFPLVYYIIEFEYRYRYPVMWISFLLGTMFIPAAIAAVSRAVLASMEFLQKNDLREVPAE